MTMNQLLGESKRTHENKNKERLKMNKRFKWFAFMLCIALVLIVFAGCTKSSDGAQNASPKANETGQNQTSQKVTLDLTSWDLHDFPNYKDSDLKKKLEAKLGVNINITERKGETLKDDYQLAILSGNPPDYFTNISLNIYNDYQKQGLLAEIPQDMIAKYAPHLMDWYKKGVGDNLFTYFIKDSKNYALPLISTISKNANVSAIREDWLNNVGITKLPETLDELHDALLRFRNNDPDKNGKKDTYGWGIQIGDDNVSSLFSPIFAAYGVYPGLMYEKNGKVVAGEIQPEAKEALQVLNQWYKEGIIDPEFVLTNKFDLLVEKFLAGKFGYLDRGYWEVLPEGAFCCSQFHDGLLKKYPNAKMTVISHPKGPKADFGHIQGNPVGGSVIAFSKNIDPKKMQKYLEFFDTIMFDKEIVEMMNFGTEGVNYKKTSDGMHEWIPPYDKDTERMKANIGLSFGKHMEDYDLTRQLQVKKEFLPLLKNAEEKAVGKYDVLAPTNRPVKDKYNHDLGTFSVKSYIDFITGTKPLDQFDQYVKDWKAKGGDQMVEESQKTYNDLFKK
jgi:putative aldouronate transport system substrate-binding protein